MSRPIAPMGLEVDVAVVGAGLGGLTAAARAAELGARVVLIEAGDRLGGTALYSGGGVHIWGAETFEAYRAHAPLADPELSQALFSGFKPYVEWLEATGAPGRWRATPLRGLTLPRYQIGHTLAPRHRARWFQYMGRYIRARGGDIRLGARATRLIVEDGRVRGVEAQQGSRLQRWRAQAVVLAAGGFQASPALLQAHVSTADNLLARAVAKDLGDGLRLALEAGAAPTADMTTVYGHLMPAPPCRIDWDDLLDPMLLTAFYAEFGVVVNARGERFVDEGAGESSGATLNAAVRQPSGGLWIILDAAIRRGPALYALPREVLTPVNLGYWRLLPYVRAKLSPHPAVLLDTIRLARDRGAQVISAPDLETLAARLGAEGLDGETLLRSLRAFNAAILGGRTLALEPEKSRSATPISTPPFWAIKVAAGISMTYGGVAIDRYGRALDAAGRPVAGLYAAPGTAGGVHHLHYAGALAACGVFGKAAADHACGALLAPPR